MPDHFIDGLSQLGLQLSEEIIKKELCYLDELLRWNQRINLTSIKNRDKAIEKHLLDSLLVLPHLNGVKQLLDMGSGGGLPGIPLAIAHPSLLVVSVDSVGKKINFQKHIKRLLQLDNLIVVQSRIEELSQVDPGQGKYDLVVNRAFSSLDTSIPHAANWIKAGGRLLAMKGPEGREELGAATEVVARYGFSAPAIFVYNLPFSHAERQLVFLTK
ncbi:MAG: 16S rRNA (guanine(527)-N(7))-methyltransferase RsmG [Desulfuromusa sp.]|nr:16S rRNA (guanine(527)-N(7))-methyltransferase RsmG [Desulfuromusa sp.]